MEHVIRREKLRRTKTFLGRTMVGPLDSATALGEEENQDKPNAAVHVPPVAETAYRRRRVEAMPLSAKARKQREVSVLGNVPAANGRSRMF